MPHFTKSSIISLTAVMNNTMTSGTKVVYLDVGEIFGICCINVLLN
jgi:hypothetical protein